ncbi:MAG: hypothetical protein AAF683_05300 [Pseudomonadota bacterium]
MAVCTIVSIGGAPEQGACAMAQGPNKSDSSEILILVGAITGLCLLIAGAVADLSLRTAQELSHIETNDTGSR